MIQDLSSLFDCGAGGSGVFPGRLRLRLACDLAGEAIWYAALNPPCYRSGSTVMNPEVLNLGGFAGGLKGAPNVISNTKHKVIGRKYMLSVQSGKLLSEPLGHRGGSRPQGLSMQANNTNGLAHIFPSKLDNLSESHSRIQGADKQPAKSRVSSGQQSNLFFPAERPGSRYFIGHRNQPFPVIKGRSGKPSHLHRFAQHSPQERHFPIDAGNLPLPSLLFVVGLCGRLQSQRFIVLQVVIGNSFQSADAKEDFQGVQIVASAFIASHSSYFAIVYIAWLYQVTLAEEIRKVLESFILRGTQNVASEDVLEIAFRSVPGVRFGSSDAPDCVTLTIRSCVGSSAIKASLPVNLPLDDRKGTLAHLIYALNLSFPERLGPNGALNSMNGAMNATRNAVELLLCALKRTHSRRIVDQEVFRAFAAKKEVEGASSQLSSTHAAALVQLVRTPDCGSGGRRFESDMPPQIIEGSRLIGAGLCFCVQGI